MNIAVPHRPLVWIFLLGNGNIWRWLDKPKQLLVTQIKIGCDIRKVIYRVKYVTDHIELVDWAKCNGYNELIILHGN